MPTQSWAGEEPIVVVLNNGIGTTAGAWFSGRVLEDKGFGPPRKGESTRRKALRMWHVIESDEVEDVSVELQVAGRKLRAKTDDEGLFDVRLRGPLPVGTHPILAKPLTKRKWRARPAALAVYPAKAATLLISDFDDTVVATNVTNKLHMVKNRWNLTCIINLLNI